MRSQPPLPPDRPCPICARPIQTYTALCTVCTTKRREGTLPAWAARLAAETINPRGIER